MLPRPPFRYCGSTPQKKQFLERSSSNCSSVRFQEMPRRLACFLYRVSILFKNTLRDIGRRDWSLPQHPQLRVLLFSRCVERTTFSVPQSQRTIQRAPFCESLTGCRFKTVRRVNFSPIRSLTTHLVPGAKPRFLRPLAWCCLEHRMHQERPAHLPTFTVLVFSDLRCPFGQCVDVPKRGMVPAILLRINADSCTTPRNHPIVLREKTICDS